MAASAIMRNQMSGVAANSMLHPRPPSLTRNHARDNMRAIREKERVNRGKKMMESVAQPPDIFRLNQFKNVPSRLHGAPKMPEARPGSGNRMHSEPPGGRAPAPVAARSPKNADAETAGEEMTGPASAKDDDEIGLEEFEKLIAEVKRKHGNAAQKPIKKDANNCPSYLRKIKDDLADKEYQAAQARRAPDAPPGYRRLPAEEIQETLAALKMKKEAVEKEFQALPLSIQTDSQKRREKAVKEKMEETDKAIKMFSAPVVLVPL